jgi:hypothetical protein
MFDINWALRPSRGAIIHPQLTATNFIQPQKLFRQLDYSGWLPIRVLKEPFRETVKSIE